MYVHFLFVPWLYDTLVHFFSSMPYSVSIENWENEKDMQNEIQHRNASNTESNACALCTLKRDAMKQEEDGGRHKLIAKLSVQHVFPHMFHTHHAPKHIRLCIRV